MKYHILPRFLKMTKNNTQEPEFTLVLHFFVAKVANTFMIIDKTVNMLYVSCCYGVDATLQML